MHNFKKILLTAAVMTLSVPVIANEMKCGNEYIAGDQIEPLLKEQVLKKCGEPSSKDYERWYYEKQGKVLHFNSNGELVTIKDVSED